MVATSIPILVVDGDDVSATRLRQCLEAAGYSATSVATAAKAVSCLDDVVPRLIVLDLGLPGDTGFELIQRLRAMPMWKDIPIVAIGSLHRIDDVHRVVRLGATDFITKPINAEGLISRVGKRVGRVPPSRA